VRAVNRVRNPARNDFMEFIRNLIEHAEGWASRNGFDGIIVKSNSKRRESHFFYPSVGYESLKEQKVYIKFLSDKDE
jgi:hypothetical protein